MRILSFDQSTKVSGYAVFDDGEYIESGVVDLKKSKLETNERSFQMAKDLWMIIKKYKPDELIIEDVQQQANPRSVIILARLAGMIIGYSEAHNVKTHILLPTQWRKALEYSQGAGIKRQELKKQSIDYVKNNFGLNLPEDECEAICINCASQKIFEFI